MGKPYRKYPNIKEFVSDAILELTKSRVSIDFMAVRKLPDKSAGQFCSSSKQLIVATGKGIDDWMPVFVHEYCHVQQWKEKFMGNEDAPWTTVWEWLGEDVDHPKEMIIQYCHFIKRYEHNNEQRAIQLIKDRKLEIDLDRYMRQASAYLWFYDVLPDIRWWPEVHPFEYTDVDKKLPNKLSIDCPAWYRKELLEQVEREKNNV